MQDILLLRRDALFCSLDLVLMNMTTAMMRRTTSRIINPIPLPNIPANVDWLTVKSKKLMILI